MKITSDRQNLLENYPYLSTALVQLLNKQTKKWGYFQIRKKDAYYCLSVPYLPHLIISQNEANLIYRVYWGYGTYKGTWGQIQELELETIIESTKVKENPHPLKASVYTKKKSKLVSNYQSKNIIVTNKRGAQIEKRQRIHEIVINRAAKYYSNNSVREIDRLIAILIRNLIAQKIAELPVDKNEVRAMVTITEE